MDECGNGTLISGAGTLIADVPRRIAGNPTPYVFHASRYAGWGRMAGSTSGKPPERAPR
ncbi:MAG: hypothetical protein ABR999_08620 [Methanoregula sp.]|uniref:hypothetical protein n=1 Tax=Methanoregula sp. TaxID=2052170 RepID=UPI003D0A1044